MNDSLLVVCPHCDTKNRMLQDRIANGARCGKCGQALFSGHPLELTQNNFDRHVGANAMPVVVDFWAPWCGPCRAMAPAFEAAAARLEPRLRLAKLNTETEPEIAGRFAIRSIPTLMLFRNGREIARQSGALDLPGLMRWVESHAG